MLKVYEEVSVKDFEAWGGAVDTINAVWNADMMDELDDLLEEVFNEDGIVSSTELNDFLWFESEFIFESLGISEEEEEED